MGMPLLMSIRKQVINPLSAVERERILADTMWVINITEEDWVINRTYGNWLIPGCRPTEAGTRLSRDGQNYTSYPIHGRVEECDQGMSRYIQVSHSALEIAQDIVDTINKDVAVGDSTSGDSFLGVFLSSSEIPSAEDLSVATMKLRAFYAKCVKVGDTLNETEAGRNLISGLMRRAAKYLHVYPEWMHHRSEAKLCPSCGESIPETAAKCKSCGAILDWDRARKFGLASEPVSETTAEPVTTKKRG